MAALDTIPTPEIADVETQVDAEQVHVSAPVAPKASGIRAILGRWWVAFWLSSLCVVSGHLMIKAGLNALTNTATVAANANLGFVGRIAHVLMQPQVVGGLLIYGFGTVCWMIAVSQKDISFLFPLSSVNYVLVVAASALMFGEVISDKRAAGVGLIVVGMIVLNRKAGTRSSAKAEREAA
jgi:uncharacterized membrane protein